MNSRYSKKELILIETIHQWKNAGIDPEIIDLILSIVYPFCSKSKTSSNIENSSYYDTKGRAIKKIDNAQESIKAQIRAIHSKIMRHDEEKRRKKEQKEQAYLRKVIEKEKAEEEKISRDYIEIVKKEDMKQREEEIKKKVEEDEEKIICPICMDQLFSNEEDDDMKPIAFHICTDVFHKVCLLNYLKEEIEKRVFPIKCPNTECGKEISDKDVKDTILDQPELLKKYENYALEFVLNSNKDYLRCPTPDCTYAFCMSFEDPQMTCPICTKSYCMACKVDWHNGMTCQQYEAKRKAEIEELKRRGEQMADEAFVQFAMASGYRKCPQCGQFNEKMSGCKAVTCLICRTPFCFLCGRKGDGHSCPCNGGRY